MDGGRGPTAASILIIWYKYTTVYRRVNPVMRPTIFINVLLSFLVLNCTCSLSRQYEWMQYSSVSPNNPNLPLNYLTPYPITTVKKSRAMNCLPCIIRWVFHLKTINTAVNYHATTTYILYSYNVFDRKYPPTFPESSSLDLWGQREWMGASWMQASTPADWFRQVSRAR